jgi:intein/homing endonuclease
VSEELRNLAKELNVLFITASQLNRCLSLDTLVEINGLPTEIRNVKVGDYLTSNEGPVKIIEVLPVIKQPVFEIITKSGKKIKCSSNHKFPTRSGLKTISTGLKVGDKLQVLRSRDK